MSERRNERALPKPAERGSPAGFRMTVQTQLVLRALMRDPARPMYGRQLSEETGLLPGTIHPIMLRLEREGWVTSDKENIDPHVEKRPARRYYQLTAAGATQASAALANARRPRNAALRDLAEGGA